ncbi:TetR/AcrR family transcriptional regulator [Streptomyces sp. NPDC002172]
MTELEKGPTGRRRGRGARERILSASQQLFREQGINRTGMDQLCAAAEVSKRTAYQHFTGKDELVAEYLRRFDPSVLSGVFDRTDLTPRERLLAELLTSHGSRSRSSAKARRGPRAACGGSPGMSPRR